jgi:hypothetical protein
LRQRDGLVRSGDYARSIAVTISSANRVVLVCLKPLCGQCKGLLGDTRWDATSIHSSRGRSWWVLSAMLITLPDGSAV